LVPIGLAGSGTLRAAVLCPRGNGEPHQRAAQPIQRPHEHGESASQPTAPVLFLSCLCPGGSSAESGSRGTEGAEPQVETIRLRLLKIAAQVRITARRIWIRYTKAYPWKSTFVSAWAHCAVEEYPEQNLVSLSHPQVNYLQIRLK